MKRIACSAVILGLLAAAPAAFAQGKAAPKKDAVPATATPPPPSPEVIKARMRPALKGTAYIEIIKGTPKAVNGELHNTTKVKNVSNAPIVGLRIDEYFYIGQKEASVGSGRLRHALAPGEIAEITTAAQLKPGINGSQLMFSHANGQVKPTAVKKFTDEKAAAATKK
ncbi:MAG TPA: hypothetical protein VFK57_20285 [Vicinamibacterales bacterium]|nr:hypothetical protein [Vicinamibacterales bacterium]